MKHILASILILFLILPGNSSDNYNFKTSPLYLNYFDPGHKQKRGAQLGKDRSAIEIYLGLQPSIGLKLNFYGSQGTVTERGYMMAGMDFDSDIYAKFGYLVNPGKRNKNKSLSAQSFGWWRLWRYVMIRKAIEIGYKGHFLDGDDLVSGGGTASTPAFYVNDEGDFSKNYGGLTANYTWIFDGNFLFDKTTWYFLDHRTARRIRLKVDAGLFMNFDKFNQPDLGFLSGSNDSTGQDYNADVTDANGFEQLVDTYPVISPFINFSIGFAF